MISLFIIVVAITMVIGGQLHLHNVAYFALLCVYMCLQRDAFIFFPPVTATEFISHFFLALYLP